MGTDRVYLKSCFSSYGFAGKYDFPCYGILRAMGTKAIYKIELCQNEKYIKWKCKVYLPFYCNKEM